MNKKRGAVWLTVTSLFAVVILLVYFLLFGNMALINAETQRAEFAAIPSTEDIDFQSASLGLEWSDKDSSSLASSTIITVTLVNDILLLNPQYYFVNLPVVCKDVP